VCVITILICKRFQLHHCLSVCCIAQALLIRCLVITCSNCYKLSVLLAGAYHKYHLQVCRITNRSVAACASISLLTYQPVSAVQCRKMPCSILLLLRYIAAAAAAAAAVDVCTQSCLPAMLCYAMLLYCYAMLLCCTRGNANAQYGNCSSDKLWLPQLV
jgi:hypothetical protein